MAQDCSPLFGELRSLARTRSIRPQVRLRALIEAAPHALDVDVVSAYLHARHVPFARSIMRARERLEVPDGGDGGDGTDYTRSKYRWWPFHFGGAWDRVPLFANLEEHRGTRVFEKGADGEWKSARSENSKTEFAKREEIVAQIHYGTSNITDPHLLVFFNIRTERLFPNKERFAEYYNLLRAVATEICVSATDEDRYEHITNQFMVHAEDFSGDIGNVGQEEPKDKQTKAIKAFFDWLVHDIGRILSSPDIRIRAYCVAEKRNGEYVISPRRLECGENNQVLVPCAISGLSMYTAPRSSDARSFDDYKQLRTITNALAALEPKKKAHWRKKQKDDIELPTPCGLITLAADTGFTLYVEDVNRRYCDCAPQYGPAYTTLDPNVRFNFVVPLLSRVDNGDAESGWQALGVVSLESKRVSALNSSQVAYIATLLALAAKTLPCINGIALPNGGQK